MASADKTVQEADALSHEVRRRLLALDEVAFPSQIEIRPSRDYFLTR
jgi:hypothetical protein